MPLQIVIQMRQVNQVQRRRVFIFNPLRGLGNPARGAVGGTFWRFDSRCRPPETEEGKFAEVFFNFLTDGIGPRINVEKFPSIRRIHRARRDGIVHARIHVEPPETICRRDA